MKAKSTKDKHLKLNQEKIEMVKEILKAKTETEAIERALDLVITIDRNTLKRKEIATRVLARRDSLSRIKGDVADWIREGREERERAYGGSVHLFPTS